ncbi:MAG: hypothetical protein P4L77_16390 [Sulfuriferula sp.]|nr:hypothetical protein [Sulfuriferula sp.]
MSKRFLNIMWLLATCFYVVAYAELLPPFQTSQTGTPMADTSYNTINTVLSQAPWFKFTWESLKLPNDEIMDRAAMMVSAKLPDTDTRFQHMVFQLDTGANMSLLYEISAHDQLPAALYASTDRPLSSLMLQFDGPFQNTVKFELLKNFGEQADSSPEAADSVPEIGTLGMDFFANAGAGFAIDYKNQHIYILSRKLLDNIMTPYPDHFMTYQETYQGMKGKILLPIKIDDVEELVIFDTGSSMAELITPPPLWQQITGLNTGNPTVKRFVAPSWGKQMTVLRGEVDKKIYIAGQWEQLKEVQTAIPYPGGDVSIIGNGLFFDDVIVVDTVNKKFGLFQRSAK